jgi:hypothetical protein
MEKSQNVGKKAWVAPELEVVDIEQTLSAPGKAFKESIFTAEFSFLGAPSGRLVP